MVGYRIHSVTLLSGAPKSGRVLSIPDLARQRVIVVTAPEQGDEELQLLGHHPDLAAQEIDSPPIEAAQGVAVRLERRNRLVEGQESGHRPLRVVLALSEDCLPALGKRGSCTEETADEGPHLIDGAVAGVLLVVEWAWPLIDPLTVEALEIGRAHV